jgi:Ca2+:H+ antiporter
MKKSSSDSESHLDRIRSWARTKAHGPSPLSKDSRRSSTLPLSNPPGTNLQQTQQNRTQSAQNDTTNVPPFPSTDLHGLARHSSKPTGNNVADNTSTDNPPPAPPPQVDGEGAVIEDETPKKKNVAMRFWLTGKSIILSSYINILLVFVPIGIAAKAANLKPGVVFGMNAVAIVPLAGLLSHATESVAKRMGDTVGALMNITFGNAVELIILYVPITPTGGVSANILQYVCLPQERSRQERARSPLKGIIISIASHIIRPSPLFPMLAVRDFERTFAHCYSLPNLTALLSKRSVPFFCSMSSMLTSFRVKFASSKLHC